MIGERCKQFALRRICSAVADNFALGELYAQLFEVRFHVLHDSPLRYPSARTTKRPPTRNLTNVWNRHATVYAQCLHRPARAALTCEYRPCASARACAI